MTSCLTRTNGRWSLVLFSTPKEPVIYRLVSHYLRMFLDLSHEFKRHVNGKGIPRKNQGLIAALQYFGLDTIAPKRKDAMRERIMQGWPFTAEELKQILDYCAEDVEMLRQLLLKMLPYIDLPLALHRGEFVAALARSEHVGVPIDMTIFSGLADKRAWR